MTMELPAFQRAFQKGEGLYSNSDPMCNDEDMKR